MTLSNSELGVDAFSTPTITVDDVSPMLSTQEIDRGKESEPVALDPDGWVSKKETTWAQLYADRYVSADREAMANYANLSEYHQDLVRKEIDARYAAVRDGVSLAAKQMARRMFAGDEPDVHHQLTKHGGAFVRQVKEELERLYAEGQREADRMIKADAEAQVDTDPDREGRGDLLLATESLLKANTELMEGIATGMAQTVDMLRGAMQHTRLAMRGEFPDADLVDDEKVHTPPTENGESEHEIFHVTSDAIGNQDVRIAIFGRRDLVETTALLLRAGTAQLMMEFAEQMSRRTAHGGGDVLHTSGSCAMQAHSVRLGNAAEVYQSLWDMVDTVERDRMAQATESPAQPFADLEF